MNQPLVPKMRGSGRRRSWSRGTASRSTPQANQVQIGVIVDTSFLGVSKRYVVRMPWGQEITAFEQNTGIRGGMAPGTQVDVRWRPEIAFLLDASQDIHAGAQEE